MLSQISLTTPTADPIVIVAKTKKATHRVNLGDLPVLLSSPVSWLMFMVGNTGSILISLVLGRWHGGRKQSYIPTFRYNACKRVLISKLPTTNDKECVYGAP